MGDIEDLHKLADLRDRGVITEQEFDRKKSDILNKESSFVTSKPAPRRKRGLWWKIPLGLAALIFFINIIDKSKDDHTQSSVTENQPRGNGVPETHIATVVTQPSEEERLQSSMPHDQLALIAAVEAGRRQYAGGQNDMAKGSSRPLRAKALCASVSSYSANNWAGKIYSLSTNGDGKGTLTIDLGSDIYVKTWNNGLSDVMDKTLIDPNSPLFAQATKLNEGQLVKFSGVFFHSDSDCIEESSMSLSGSIRSPEFIMGFRRLSAL